MTYWRKSIALILSLSMLTLMGCSGGNGTAKAEGKGAPAKGAVQIRIAHDNNVNTPVHEAFLKFEELVEEKTDGKYDVVIFPGAQMGSVQDTLEQVRRGELEMSASTTSNFTSTIPKFAVWESFYMFDDNDHAKRVLESDAGKKMMEPLADMGLTGIGYMELGFRNFSNSMHPIEKVEDIKGLKMRGYNPIQIAAWESVGAVPTAVSWGELFTSLQQKLIDGQECATSSFFNEKFYEAQSYWSLTKHVFTNFLWYANADFMNGLPEEDKTVVMDCAKEAIDYNWQRADEVEKEVLGQLADEGFPVNEVTLEVRQQIGEIMNATIKDMIIEQCGEDVYEMIWDAIETERA